MNPHHIDRLAPTSAPEPARLGSGSWIIMIVLLALLVATGFVGYLGWTLGEGTEVSTAGYVAHSARSSRLPSDAPSWRSFSTAAEAGTTNHRC